MPKAPKGSGARKPQPAKTPAASGRGQVAAAKPAFTGNAQKGNAKSGKTKAGGMTNGSVPAKRTATAPVAQKPAKPVAKAPAAKTAAKLAKPVAGRPDSRQAPLRQPAVTPASVPLSGAQPESGKPSMSAPSQGPAVAQPEAQAKASPIGWDWSPDDQQSYARNMLQMFDDSGKLWGTLVSKASAPPQMPDMSEAAKALGSVTEAWVSQPDKLLEAQTALATRYFELWQSSLKRGLGQPVAPVAQPAPGDNRFKDPDWSEHPYFDVWKQYYLITAQWLEELVEKAEGVDPRTRQRADFYLRQLISAAAPSNHPLTNPEVMRTIFASKGESLIKGMANFRRDLEKSDSTLSIAQTDTEAFEVGRNIATTPGKVVFQNAVMQLLQYAPTTKTVHRVPLLIVPPWINKFYILDLQPQKSFIKYAVDQGFTVFVVSWVNPDSSLAHKTFEDYAREGILAATDAVSRATDVHRINALGYCVGGTLLATTLAWLAAGNEDRFRSATFLAAQVDFEKAGDLLVFIDEQQLQSIDKTMAEAGGVLDGARMAQVFNMMRPKDLIWPYVVNNYLLGKKPMAFDLLFWNQDSTRMAQANHSFYLRNFYHENRLAKGTMNFAGRHLDMAEVTLPVYELATREDHIAPAESVYRGAVLFGGAVRYVLAGSGHIAGVINPPGKPKYQYWTSDELPPTLKEWQAGASETPGSWWPDWVTWLANLSGEPVKARQPGDGLKVLEDAPGSYVRTKS